MLLCLVSFCLQGKSGENQPAGEMETWRRIKPLVTTEADIIRDYGVPDGVWLSYTELNTLRQKETAAGYTFNYSFSKSRIQDGPLGEASETLILFTQEGKVERVSWDYKDGYRLHTRTRESRTKITERQIEDSLGGSPAIHKIKKADGGLSATVYTRRVDGGTISVQAHVTLSSVAVYLTPSGTYDFEKE